MKPVLGEWSGVNGKRLLLKGDLIQFNSHLVFTIDEYIGEFTRTEWSGIHNRTFSNIVYTDGFMNMTG